ncbi:DEAD/DEAH box helicase, putative [Plasmodium reichenowi]|uniref:DEAD/DEAH box helicase, putative n=1 Tax=Plasmodium reichenowi TaxID=5854 RepID=A0A060RWZ8_PLARE|nr:DEAD/DEAH box helicase, putative [Plasmodium reichenowi]
MDLMNDEYDIDEPKERNIIKGDYDDDNMGNGFSIINSYKDIDLNDINDLESIVKNDEISVDRKLEYFYSKLNSNIFDIFRIVADYENIYIISGEGLIIYVCMLLSKFYSFKNEEDKNILSFDNSLNMISVVYYIEKILSDICACNSNFHIIFFNVFNIFFEKKKNKLFQNYNLLRNAFIIHCKKNLIPYFIFNNWYNDENYNIYLIKYKPLFMFVEDSSSFLYAFNKYYVSNVNTHNKENNVNINQEKKNIFVDNDKNINGDHYDDDDDDKNIEKKKNYKEYIYKKNIYDTYNNDIREMSLCFYFLLLNNILRDIKCVFFFNLESEKNTINAFSINYTGVNFEAMKQLNDKASLLFDNVYYEKKENSNTEEINDKVSKKGCNINDCDSSNVLYINIQNIKDYDILYKEDNKNYNDVENKMLDRFMNNVKEQNVDLKNMALHIFFCKIIEEKEHVMDMKKKEYKYFHLVMKILFLHNYLLEKMNMLNLCIDNLNEFNDIYKIIKEAVHIHICDYLDVYNFLLKLLQRYEYSNILKSIRNSDLLNFFNSSIIQNLINFLCQKISQDVFIIEYDDMPFEDKDNFEMSYKNILKEKYECLFPIDLSFLRDDISMLCKRGDDATNNANEDNIINSNDDRLEVVSKNKEVNDDNKNIVTINLIRIKNELVETFFYLNDISHNNNNNNNCEVDNMIEEKKREMVLKIIFINKCLEYDNNFFELTGMLHISERENVVDIFNSYMKLSSLSRNLPFANQKDEKYKLRRQQKDERRKAIIAKYFYISSLHHPIVISENHPWIKYYSYNIEKLYDYLRNEEKKKGITQRMKVLFDSSSEREDDEKDGDTEIVKINNITSDVKNKNKKNKRLSDSKHTNEKTIIKKKLCTNIKLKKNNDIFEILDDHFDEDSDRPEDMNSINEHGNKKEDSSNKKGKNETKVGKKGSKNSNATTLSRKDEILKKKELSNEKKTYEVDLERYNNLEQKIVKLASDDSYAEMNIWSLDIISGYNRLVDVYNFNNITNLIKSVDLQIKISMKVLNSMFHIIMYTKLKNIKTGKQKSDAIRSIILIYRLTNDIFNKFKEHLSEKDVVQIQTVLLSLGFQNSSYNLFEEYVKLKKDTYNNASSNDGKHEFGNKVDECVSSCKKGKENKKEESNSKKKISKGKKENNDTKDVNLKKGFKKGDVNNSNTIKSLDDIYKYKLESVKTYSELKIDENKEHEFQLYYMYYLLDRTTGNIKDSRVLFTLDTWQYNILNLVDRRKSILVSCPTSSGKTFICYYVMDKVLRLNNDSVVIYVAPNDTLALQIYHEVNGRFSTKGYSKYGGNKLCSYMTDKYAEEKALDSQIIIILPSILENILLSYYALNDMNENMNVSKFISKIEYIIFDEIHCIGDKEFYGSQIENIIHLINCPFLALSATIGNINCFYSWLQNVLLKKGRSINDLHLIKFYERFSDLILYVYTNKNLHHLNPLTCFNFRDILYKGINKDFYCNPREIYEIIIILFELARKKNFYHLVEFLEPSFYFQYTRCINKKKFIYYMHSVKEMIVYLIQNNYINNLEYDMIIHILLSNYMKNSYYIRDENEEDIERKNKINNNNNNNNNNYDNTKNIVDNEEVKTNDKVIKKSDKVVVKNLYKSTIRDNVPKEKLFQELYKRVNFDEKYISNRTNDLVKYTEMVNMEQEYLDSDKLIELLKKLEDINFLPCIVFNFERKELEDMTINLINELMKRQHDKYYGDEERAFNTKMENKMRREKYENMLKQREMLLKMKSMSRNQRLEQNIDKEYLDMLIDDEIPEPPLDVSEEYDKDFYFCNQKVYCNYVTEIEDLIKDAQKAIEGRKYKSILIEGLRRGIGLHYEVLPYKFTIIVESLFRLGFVKIIFSNKNLSLGINIPCRSIIFAGHTIELNSLMFKQTSGRAGRRGFDLYGNIIIWNINFKNLKRLITSPLQTLSGTYSVNFTNICRSMLLYNSLKRIRENEEGILKNKVIVNKPNKKKKKDETLSVAEKEEIFEKNRAINVNYFSRINGILSLFFNSLYYINSFEESKQNYNNMNNVVVSGDNVCSLTINYQNGNENGKGHINNISTCTTTSTSSVNNMENNNNSNMNGCGDKKSEGSERHDMIQHILHEFNEYKENDKLSKFINREYEYNELLVELLTNRKMKNNKLKEEKKMNELCFMTRAHFHIFLNVLIEMEALDEEGNIINLTELSIFLKKEYDNNLIITYLLIKKVLHNIIGDNTFLSSSVVISLNRIIDSITFEKNYYRSIIVDDATRGQFILLFILSHFINKRKENKIALTKALINSQYEENKSKLELFSSYYFPLLHALPSSIQKHIDHIENILLKYLVNYCLVVLIKLNLLNKKKAYLLPYTKLYIFQQHPCVSLKDIFPKKQKADYFKFYESKLRDYKVRSPFLVSLFKGDDFKSLDELLYTCLQDFDLRKDMLPDIVENYVSFYKYEDGIIKEEKICLNNSYILDYYIHGKYDVLRNKNNLGQYTWYIIDRFINSLKNIEHFLYEVKRERLLLSSDVFYTNLNTLKDYLERNFKSINSLHVKNN